jgi:hypothetical protein
MPDGGHENVCMSEPEVTSESGGNENRDFLYCGVGKFHEITKYI